MASILFCSRSVQILHEEKKRRLKCCAAFPVPVTKNADVSRRRWVSTPILVRQRMTLSFAVAPTIDLRVHPRRMRDLRPGSVAQSAMSYFSITSSHYRRAFTSSALSLEELWYETSPVTRSRASSEASGSMSFHDLDGKARKDILFQSGNVLAS